MLLVRSGAVCHVQVWYMGHLMLVEHSQDRHRCRADFCDLRCQCPIDIVPHKQPACVLCSAGEAENKATRAFALCCRSLCSIPAGQQLTISYVELAATRQERKRQLLRQYFFDIDAAAAPAAAGAAAAGGKAAQALPMIAEEAGGAATSGAANEQQQPGASKAQQQLQQQPLRMQLQVQLPQAVITSQQQLAQHTAIGSASSTSNRSSSRMAATLLSYTTSSSPWPADRPDRQLCQLLLMHHSGSPPNNNNSNNSNVGQQQQLVKLPGGICLFANQAYSESGDDAAAAAAAAAAGLFKDLEGLEVSAGADVAEGTSTLDGDVEQNQEQQQQQQQQVQQLEVVQWGDWAKASASAAAAGGLGLGIGNCTSSTSNDSSSTDSLPDALVVRAAHLLLHVWALHQQAEQLTSNGYPAAAVQLYQQALAAADGAATLSCSLPMEHTSAAGASSSSSSSSSGSSLVLGAKHILRARVNAGLLKAAVDEGSSWEVALAAAQALTPVYELVYPQVGKLFKALEELGNLKLPCRIDAFSFFKVSCADP
jgi:hypothetical protein